MNRIFLLVLPICQSLKAKAAQIDLWGLSVYGRSHHLQVRETTVKDGAQLGPRFRFDLYSND